MNSASRWMMIAAGLAVLSAVVVFAMRGYQTPVAAQVDLLAAANAPKVPNFSLVDSRGQTVSLDDLLGKVWVADFIFTRCAGPCPTITQNLEFVDIALKNEPDARLVTFTLDPENDTPDVMVEYGRRFQADPGRWLFLTSHSASQMREMVQKGFLQTVEAATPNSPIIHSTYMVVVDRKGRMRGFFDGIDVQSRAKVAAAVRALLAEPPSS